MNLPRLNGAVLIRMAGLLLVAMFATLLLRYWHPVYRFTAFLQLDASSEAAMLPALRELPVYIFRNTGGYDGQYYAQIAYDPSLSDPALRAATDNLAYRGRRILPPALAWLFAFGQPALIVHVYTLLNVVAWFALAWLLWRFLPVSDPRSLLAWAGVLFSAGAIASVRLALTDLIALVILAAGLIASESNRSGTAFAFLGAAGLARETSLLALGGIVRAPWFSRQNFLRGLGAIGPLAVWLFHLRQKFGSVEAGWVNFTIPPAGLVEKWRQVAQAVLQGNPDHAALAWTTLLSLIALCTQLVYFAGRWRWQDAWWRVGAGYAVMMLCLGGAVWGGFPGAATRLLLPLTLAFNVVAVRTRAGFGWLIAGNLAIASGLLTLGWLPTDPLELAAARSNGTAIVAQTGDGWYGVERSSRHSWSWSRGHGVLQMKAWPARSASVEFQGVLRSLAPCTVTVTQHGRVLWRGEAGTTKTPFAFSFLVETGQAELIFSTDAAGVAENSTPGSRRLAFAVYDVRLSIPGN